MTGKSHCCWENSILYCSIADKQLNGASQPGYIKAGTLITKSKDLMSQVIFFMNCH